MELDSDAVWLNQHGYQNTDVGAQTIYITPKRVPMGTRPRLNHSRVVTPEKQCGTEKDNESVHKVLQKAIPLGHILLGITVAMMLCLLVMVPRQRVAPTFIKPQHSDIVNIEVTDTSEDKEALWLSALHMMGLTGALELYEGVEVACRGLGHLSEQVPQLVGSAVLLYYAQPIAAYISGLAAGTTLLAR